MPHCIFIVHLEIPMHHQLASRSNGVFSPTSESSHASGRSGRWTGHTVLFALMMLFTFNGSQLHADVGNSDSIGQPRVLSQEEIRQGWLQLFDGESFFGWQNASTANWEIQDRCLTVDQGQAPGLLATTTQFDCYRLRVDFWASAETNSGIFLRTSPRPKSPSRDCIELNIAQRDLSPFPTGSLVERKSIDEDVTPDTWHRFDIKLLPQRVVVELDGQMILDEEIQSPSGRGFIGLQFNQGEAKFCNIFLQPLRLAPLFNGRDLSGWRTYPQMKTQSTVTNEGALELAGGRGQIESMGTFGDFVLQLECRTLTPLTNSGVFFRCIPTEEMNGYEAQIQNEIVDGNPEQPADCGTGGIFRRVDARRVNAQDGEWFTMTLIAVGPRFSAWVNGLQVTDWRDDRKEDLNPRRGLRLQPGTLMLQGHDPMSLVQFRGISAVELKPRIRK